MSSTIDTHNAPDTELAHPQPHLPKTQQRVLLAGIGFFSDAYDLFVLNLVLLILDTLYQTSAHHKAILSSTALAGAIIGQLIFGVLGDVIGRTPMWVLTLLFIIMGSLGSSLSPSGDVYLSLTLWRFILGLGIGGEYPLASTVTSEASSDTRRGANTAKVFSAQGWGKLAAPILVVGLLAVVPETHRGLEIVWRAALGFGAIPSILSLPARWRLFREDIGNYSSTRLTMRERWDSIVAEKRILLGTCGSWFLFDVTFYANGLFSATLLSLLGGGSGGGGGDSNSQGEQVAHVKQVALENVLIALMALPGYYSAVYLIDRWGRRPLQQFGFLGMGLVYMGMGVWTELLLDSHRVLFVILYGFSFYFSNLGPNTTTFVVSSEVFPKETRTSCAGLSAACGKLGAVCGALVYPFMLEGRGTGPSGVLLLSAGVAFGGLFLSLAPLVPETKHRPLSSVTLGSISMDRDMDSSGIKGCRDEEVELASLSVYSSASSGIGLEEEF